MKPEKKKKIIIIVATLLAVAAAGALFFVFTRQDSSKPEEESKDAETTAAVPEVTKESMPDVTGLNIDDGGATYTTADPEYAFEAYTEVGGSKAKEPDVPSASDRILIRVDANHPLPGDYGVYVTELTGEDGAGKYIATQCYPDLVEMMTDCAAAGCSPYVLNGFLTGKDLKNEFEKTEKELLFLGYTKGEAEALAVKLVGRNGSSEYETGFVVDIVDKYDQNKGTPQQYTPTTEWLNEHCYDYGFILRFPYGKQNTTGVTYTSWHYRYVGRAAAKIIKDSRFSLEEFYTYLAENPSVSQETRRTLSAETN